MMDETLKKIASREERGKSLMGASHLQAPGKAESMFYSRPRTLVKGKKDINNFSDILVLDQDPETTASIAIEDIDERVRTVGITINAIRQTEIEIEGDLGITITMTTAVEGIIDWIDLRVLTNIV